MDQKLRQMNRLLKRYDSDLVSRRYMDGALAILRKRRGYDFYRMPGDCVLWFGFDWEQLVLPLTDNWIETGKPVDWGIEPILAQMQKIDGWRDDSDYDRFCEDRQRRRDNKQRAFRNEMRARAYDLRRDFARATNDINTSSLNRIERRRIHDGYRG